MAWNDSPPTEQELKLSWNAKPPIPEDLGIEQPIPSTQPISKTESVARGVGTGLTLGFQPELSSKVENAAIGIHNLFGKPMEYSTPADFHTLNDQAKKANPKSYLGGEIGGAIAGSLPMMLSGAGEVGVGVTGAKVAPGLIGKTIGAVSKAAAESPVIAQGIYGAVQGAGMNPENRIKGAVTGAAIGAVTAGIMKKIPDLIDQGRVVAARRTLGFTKGELNKTGLSEANDAAKTLLDSGAIKMDFVDTAKQVNDLKETAGKYIGDTLDNLDAYQASKEAMGQKVSSVFNKNKIMADFRNKEMWPNGPTIEEYVNLPASKGMKADYENLMKTFQDSQFASDTFNSMQNLKKYFQSIAYPQGGQSNPVASKAYIAVRDGIDSAIENASTNVKNPELAAKFMDAKKAYGAAKTVETAIEKKLNGIAGNRILSLTDFIFAGSNLPSAAGKVLLKHGAEKYTLPAFANFGGVLSKPLNFISPIGTPALTTIGNQISKENK